MKLRNLTCAAIALTFGLGLGTAHAEDSWFDSIKSALGLSEDAADSAADKTEDAAVSAGDAAEGATVSAADSVAQ